jgi:hypothetical protein
MFTASLACEAAIKGIWGQVTDSDFPYRNHKPSRWVDIFGISSYYTPETRRFLEKFGSWASEQIRFESTQAYRDHIKPSARGRGQLVVLGVARFIDETEQLSSNPDVVSLLWTVAGPSGT